MSYHGLDKLSIGLSGTFIWELIKKNGTTTTHTSTNTETYASISKVLHLDKTYAITTTQMDLMSLTSGQSGPQVWKGWGGGGGSGSPRPPIRPEVCLRLKFLH